MRTPAFILTFLFALGCTPEAPQDGLLERERFKAVLLEAQLIEARVNQEITMEIVHGSPAQRYYDELFAAHGIEREAFERTFEHYAQRPSELKQIYDEVFGTLMHRKDSIAQ